MLIFKVHILFLLVCIRFLTFTIIHLFLIFHVHTPTALIWHSKLCLKDLIDEYPWLQSVDSQLLGSWKTIHYRSKNRLSLHEIKEAYGMTSVTVIKAALTWWLSETGACKVCRERHGIIIETLDKILFKVPKPKLIS